MNKFRYFITGVSLALLVTMLVAATSGNIQWTQLASSARHGTAGTRGQSSDNTGASGHYATYNATGDLTDGGASAPPSGTAGGDLSGTYPNPTVAQVNGAVVPTSAAAVKTNSSKQLVAALAADIVSLFSTCSGTQYLGADGSCHTASAGNATFTPTGTATCSGTCTTGTGSAVVTVAGTTITFASIPGTFNNLQLVLCARSTVSATADSVKGGINGDTTAGDYIFQGIFVTGSGTNVTSNLVNSSGPLLGYVAGNTATASRQGCFTSTIPAYAGTTFQKITNTHGTYDQGVSGLATIDIGLNWINTSAVTSLVLTLSSGGNFIAGSSAFLYGY